MRRPAALSLALLLLSAPALFAQRRPGIRTDEVMPIKIAVMMTGNASQQNRVPRETRIELLAGNNIVVRERYVDEMGQAEFEGCEPGVYRVRVSGPGIETRLSDRFSADLREGMHFEMVSVFAAKDANVSQEQKPLAPTVSALEANVPDRAAREFRRGVQAMEGGKWQKAQQHFEAAVAAFPSYPSAYNNLGVAYMTLGDPAQGARAFERAVELDPKYARASYNLGKLRFAANDLPAAEQLFTSALATEPNNPEILVALANVQLVRGAYPEAVATARHVHQGEHAAFAVAHFIAARALQAQNLAPQAAAEYRLFLQEAPSDRLAPQARQLLAQLEKH